ncbi:type IV secretory system conjugative DNA transfer family protein [Candidatus Parcubacteria bacterium]|nr:type IV secretory system conjugative DNA transfer family protein [Candidatus Parcubacteria bacterium]
MEQGSPKFSSLEEEVRYLRAQVAEKERVSSGESKPSRETLIKNELSLYGKSAPESMLAPERHMSSGEAEAIVLDLAPKGTDAQIEELIVVLQEKGLLNALKIVEKAGNPLLEDDFHRFLVQYLKKGLPLPSAPSGSTLFQALQMVLYEVSLPETPEGGGKERPLKELLSSMEQFYAGMSAVTNGKDNNWFALEVAVSNDSSGIVVYAAVPSASASLFEKQFLSIFPGGKLLEQPNDYNIFSEPSTVSFAEGSFANPGILPLKMYDQFDYDPLNVLLNSFSKIAAQGEGAAVQFIIGSPKIDYLKKYRNALQDLGKGKPLKQTLDIRESFAGEIAKDVGLSFKDLFSSAKKKEDKPLEIGEKERAAMEGIKRKMASPIVSANVRLVVSAGEKERAETLLTELESSFHQFEDTSGNKLRFTRLKGSALASAVRDFSFRTFSDKAALPVSLKELSTLFHFPPTGIKSAPDLKQSRTATAPAPSSFASSGILLGMNRHRATDTKVILGKEDRLRHFYAIGQTGTGKSTLLKNMIIQDIQNGDGVCMIDPHGSDLVDILAAIPKERYEDVIYFDPSHTARPMSLNMLEYDERFPEQKTFVVNELLTIFNKLFDMKVAGGPAFEQYFRNSALLVMEHPESGSTLLEIGRVLADADFRKLKMSHCQNPIIKQFWENAERTTGEQSLANFVPYVTNKFDVFVTNEIMRPVIAQQHSSFNFREIMDTKKIFLVNLSKGRLGDINSRLIGLILVGKMLMAALSRVDSFGQDLPPFYLYIDEFQNITTDSISTILSEARKYKLSLTIAHQYVQQLEEGIKNAVFGNVGSMAAFRVGAPDAEFLEKQFAPTFAAHDIANIDNFNAYIKMLVNGKPEKPFNIEMMPPFAGDKSIVEPLRELSYLKYGRDREEVEEEILARYKGV